MTPYPRISSFDIDPARFSAMIEEFRAYTETEEKKMSNDYEEMGQESRLYPWLDLAMTEEYYDEEWLDSSDLWDDEDDGQPSEYDEWQDVHGGDDWDHGQFDGGE